MKEIGLTSELKFHVEAVDRGLILSVPCGEQVYDCVVDNGDTLFKIQVKSTSKERFEKKDSFRVILTSGVQKRAYTKKEIDIFAILIIPLSLWYLIPQNEIDGKMQVQLRPHCKSCPFRSFVNNWDIFNKRSYTSSQFSGYTT